MPVYKYTAKDIDGKALKGTYKAEDRAELAGYLYTKQQYLIRCTESDEQEAKFLIKPKELSSFCRELGVMLSAGIPLVRAMNIIMDRDMPKKLRGVYQRLQRDIQQGIGISEAMRKQSGTFPELMINMFYSGESTGKLDRVAAQMAGHYEKDFKNGTKLRNAMIYPIILLSVSLVVVLALFVFMLPNFFKMFEGIEFPLSTRIIMAMSNALIEHWFGIGLFLLAVVASVSVLLRSQNVRTKLDEVKLKIPKIGKLLEIIYTARFARTLSSLYSSGIAMLNALQIARGTVGNRYIEKQFDKVIELVRVGTPLSKAIEGIKGFDTKLASTILIGEETGQLDGMLGPTADSYDYESEMAIERLTAMLEPALIIFMAIIIGFIMVSVMLPVFQAYQSIG